MAELSVKAVQSEQDVVGVIILIITILIIITILVIIIQVIINLVIYHQCNQHLHHPVQHSHDKFMGHLSKKIIHQVRNSGRINKVEQDFGNVRQQVTITIKINTGNHQKV